MNAIGGSYEGLQVERLSDPSIWRVTFEGNSQTSEDTSQTYGLYRCATLALEQGYDGFEVLSNIKLNDPSDAPPATAEVVTGPFPVNGLITAHAIGFSVFSSEIRLVKKPLSDGPPKAFDAVLLKAALDQYVLGKKCENGNVCPHAHDYLHANP